MMNVYMGADVEDFIFGESTTYGYNEVDNVTDEEMNTFGVIECFDDPDVACYRIALENEQNYNAIMTAMMTQEIIELESGAVHEDFKDMKNTAKKKAKKLYEWIKEQVKRFWAKVQGVFKKVMDTLSSFVLSNKAFVKKYRGVASKLQKPDSEKKFTGYNFGDLTVPYSAVGTLLKSEASTLKSNLEKKNDIKDAKAFSSLVRGKLVGSNNGVDANDFDKAIRSKLYGNNGNTVEITPEAFSNYLNFLEDANSEKKSAKDAYNEAKKSIKEMLNAIRNAETTAENEEFQDRYASEFSKYVNASLTIMSSVLSYQTRAIVAKAQQYRKIANWYVRGQKVEGFGESTTTNSLDNLEINLI